MPASRTLDRTPTAPRPTTVGFDGESGATSRLPSVSGVLQTVVPAKQIAPKKRAPSKKLPKKDALDAFVHRNLRPDSSEYQLLKSKHFLFDDKSQVAIDLLALKYRTRAERLSWFTGLHIFVVTLPLGHKAFSSFCKRQMAVIRHLIGVLEDADSRRTLLGWI